MTRRLFGVAGSVLLVLALPLGAQAPAPAPPAGQTPPPGPPAGQTPPPGPPAGQLPPPGPATTPQQQQQPPTPATPQQGPATPQQQPAAGAPAQQPTAPGTPQQQQPQPTPLPAPGAPTSPTPGTIAPAQPPTASLPTPQPPAPPPPQVSPEQHLAEAQSALERVQDSALARSGTRKSMSQLRKDFDELVSSYKESGTWRLCLHDVERDLVLLIGGGGPEPENLKAAVSKDAVSDPATRETLKEFRTSVELFYDATINNTR